MKHAAPVVVALGGHAISSTGSSDAIDQQFGQTARTARAIADLVASGVPTLITHGNGPQIGHALRRVELAAEEVYELPLHICVADVQGGIGYMIAQCVTNELRGRGIDRTACTVVTSVEVADDDPAFSRPSKPIGATYTPEQAARYRGRRGWTMVETAPGVFRRVVPSPRPLAIVEIALIRHLVEAGEVVVAVGGGGVPVVAAADGTLQGREAVIDKDLASGLLASQLGAGTLVNITAVDRVSLDFGRPTQRELEHLTVSEARAHLAAGQFPAGSMGPKIEAAVGFLESTPHTDPRVIICSIEGVAAALSGAGGTIITRH